MTNTQTEQKILAVDFDGTIVHYEAWMGRGQFGQVVKGASEFIAKLKDEGWTIIIHTCRPEVKEVREFLIEEGISFDHVNYSPKNEELGLSPHKVAASVYLDDRAVCFNGNWKKAYKQVKRFQRWEERM